MRHAFLAVIALACGCAPPPTIGLEAGSTIRLINFPQEITAVVAWSDGSPFRGAVDFTTTSGRIWPPRVKADFTGTAKTSLSSEAPGQLTVTASAAGATASLVVLLALYVEAPPHQPPPPAPQKPFLLFRASPTEAQVGAPVRSPIVAVELPDPLSAVPVLEEFDRELPITLAVSSCPATLAPASPTMLTTFARLAIFDGLIFDTPGTGCQLVASTPGLRSISSQRFDVLP